MKVTVLTHMALPSHLTNTEQTVWTFMELARLGHHVEVICPGERARDLRAEVGDYYGIASLPETITFTPTGDARAGWADLRNVRQARRAEAGLVHTRDIFALTLALVTGMRCVFESYRVDFNRDPRFALWRGWCYRRRNLLGIVTHSELSRRSFIEAGAPADRVMTIYNGYVPAHFEPRLSKEAARARLGLDPQAALVVYTGHVNPSKGVEVLAQIARKIPEATFLLVGALPGEKTDLGPPNVRLLPRVPQDAVPAYLFAADCLIIPPASAPLRRHGRTVLPMKTFAYLAAGRPIVAGDLPDLREVLRSEENALLVKPDDPAEAAAVVRQVLTESETAGRLSEQAREDARFYTWQARAQKLAGFYSTHAA